MCYLSDSFLAKQLLLRFRGRERASELEKGIWWIWRHQWERIKFSIKWPVVSSWEFSWIQKTKKRNVSSFWVSSFRDELFKRERDRLSSRAVVTFSLSQNANVKVCELELRLIIRSQRQLWQQQQQQQRYKSALKTRKLFTLSQLKLKFVLKLNLSPSLYFSFCC